MLVYSRRARARAESGRHRQLDGSTNENVREERRGGGSAERARGAWGALKRPRGRTPSSSRRRHSRTSGPARGINILGAGSPWGAGPALCSAPRGPGRQPDLRLLGRRHPRSPASRGTRRSAKLRPTLLRSHGVISRDAGRLIVVVRALPLARPYGEPSRIRRGRPSFQSPRGPGRRSLERDAAEEESARDGFSAHLLAAVGREFHSRRTGRREAFLDGGSPRRRRRQRIFFAS